jgi:hypothetical protein
VQYENYSRARRASSPSWAADLEFIYPVPDIARAEADRRRHRHRDLAGMSRRRLFDEIAALSTRLELEDPPHPWLYARLRAITRRLRRVH